VVPFCPHFPAPMLIDSNLYSYIDLFFSFGFICHNDIPVKVDIPLTLNLEGSFDPHRRNKNGPRSYPVQGRINLGAIVGVNNILREW